MSAEIIQFVARPERVSFTGQAAEPRSLYPEAVFHLPFVTQPVEQPANWRVFWQETELWNCEISGKPHEDCSLGRQYARAAVAAFQEEGVSSPLLLEKIVDRMIERAFTRRGPGGRLCRQLDNVAQGFIREVCKAALSQRGRS